MPYKEPYRAPSRRLAMPAGHPQLGFDPITIAATLSTFVNKLKGIGGLFKSNGPDWSGTAQRALSALMAGSTANFENSGMNPREFIKYYSTNANSQTGRNVYLAAQQAVAEWDAQRPAPSIFTPSAPTYDPATGQMVQAGMSPVMMFLLAGAVVGGVVLMKKRKA